MKKFSRYMVLFLALFSLAGCAELGIKNPFATDPLTGGADARTSILLNVNLPTGLQRYAAHGYIAVDPNGMKQGLETFRGDINGASAAVTMFNTLKQAGWQLCMYLRKGERAVYLYKKAEEYGLLVFHMQGMLTIMEIWAGPQLPPDSSLNFNRESPAIQPEEYAPLTEPEKGQEIKWGGKIEEREL